jgi:precorrin-2 dehydrogenase/sirohydrochlorin ferrochelatase
MIISLNLEAKKVFVIGGGKESFKRINSLLNENCKITVISNKISKPIENLVKKKKIEFKNQKLENANFLLKENPFIVITTTDNKELNQLILDQAKKNRIIAYSSDNPGCSDFSNPAIIDLENLIQIGIFTGGRSPVMAKKIKEQVEKILEKTITKQDLGQIKIQQIARTLAKRKIDTQIRRKSFLKTVIDDKEIKQLIKEGESKKAENRVIAMLRDWK